ncbi:hypothetical protein GOODEAATRI_004668, partial [Goodea atripinnis]
RLMASLIMDFLQVFNLDFSLAVFQPEINTLNGLDSRDLVCRELGLSDSELNRNSPVLLELVRRGRQTDNPAVHSKTEVDLSSRNMLERFVDDELRAADNRKPKNPNPSPRSVCLNCSQVVPDSNESRHQTQNLEDKPGSPPVNEDVEYDDDFNSHRSDLSNGELSIGEEIEEVSIEGPENSDKV